MIYDSGRRFRHLSEAFLIVYYKYWIRNETYLKIIKNCFRDKVLSFKKKSLNINELAKYFV